MSSEKTMKLGPRLAELRKTAKIGNQEVLGRALGVTKNTIWHYESGRTLPDLDLLANFAKLTGADLNELIQLRLAAGGHDDAARMIKSLHQTEPRFDTNRDQLQGLRMRLTVSTVPTEWALLITELVAGGKMSVEAGGAIADFFDNWRPDSAWLSQLEPEVTP
jgi:transcriptional regulator with XRE-family HTH domain